MEGQQKLRPCLVPLVIRLNFSD
ncbi:hypothetical protein Zm00014a_024645 [Zea mays]|uniref:Uncharacterized protein n=1 Tax=Zea mays TaxID=4577 RepID=A0A3L6G8G5_MAIZE|nr:hypothetical protein Zm00014a_024645 [Zea mays]